MAKALTSESPGVRDTILDVGQRIMAGKGFSAVGLNEILVSAGVPKGSFYHYFGSKDAFGEALLARYFEAYLAEMDVTLRNPNATMAGKLLTYFGQWRTNQSFDDCQGKCLAVKLGAEVADLSEAMRLALKRGTSGTVSRLAVAIEAGVAEGSLAIDSDANTTAHSLYQLWLGASIIVKIVRNTEPFESALVTTRQLLHIPSV